MAGELRALSFTRDGADLPVQRAVFRSACAARGWTAGGSVCQMGAGLAGWSAVVRLVRSGAYGVVVVDSIDRLAAGETGRMAVLALLRRSGVRLLAVRDGIDTGDTIGADLVGSLLDADDRPALIAA